MAKSKKKKNQDFQKVKLKVGKKLKKGENVTNASFKSRSIQISQKLKVADTSQPTTRKKQNINEVLAHCRHHSAGERLEAVTGLRELVSSNLDIVHAHLPDILERAAEMFSDKDSIVRQGVVKKVLAVLLPMITEKQIAPFFPLVCAHLCCAMTHINDGIKVDSLHVVDKLLEFYPRLMISKSNQVLSNFIEQISRQKGQGDARSLSSNPDSKTSTTYWRKSVLKRLQKFLEAILLIVEGEQSLTKKADSNENVMVSTFDTEDGLNIQVFPNYVQRRWDNPGFVYSSSQVSQGTGASGEPLESRIEEFATTLVPLLLECWVEASPSAQQARGSNRNKGPAEKVDCGMMHSVVKVTQLLWRCMHKLRVDRLGERRNDEEPVSFKRYEKEFVGHFMWGFPYSVTVPMETGKKSKKQNQETSMEQVSSETLNLAICDVMTSFLFDDPLTTDSPWLTSVLEYVTQIMTSGKGYCDASQVVRLMENLGQSAAAHGNNTSELYENLFKRYQFASPKSQEKKVYLQFFAGLVLQDKTDSHISNFIKESFLCSLPELLTLCSERNPELCPLIIRVMKQACCQGCTEKLLQHKNSKQCLLKMFDPESGVILSLKSHDQRELTGLLYFMPHLQPALIKQLTSLCRCEQLEEAEVQYLIQVLHSRYECYKQEDYEILATLYMSVLANLLIGYSKSDLSTMSKSSPAPVSGLQTVGLVNTLTDEPHRAYTWDRHVLIVECVCSVVRQCRNTEEVTMVLLSFLQTVMCDHPEVPIEVVYSVCKLADLSFDMPAGVTSLVQDGAFSLVSFLVTCDAPANQSAVSVAMNAGCDVILNMKGALKVLLSKAAETLRQGTPDFSCLRVLLMFLTDDRKLKATADPQCVELLHTLRASVGNIAKAGLPVDVQKLIATFDYTVSMIVQ